MNRAGRADTTVATHITLMGRAMLVVDVQNDFIEGGSVPIPGGQEVARPLSELACAMAEGGWTVYASRDWHPPKTHHFHDWGGKWTPHCVQGTWGARFPPDLVLPEGTVIVSKGMDPRSEGYSVFEGVDPLGEPFARSLEDRRVRQLLMGGLATDHCVRETAMDARMRGLRVELVVDAIRAVDPSEGERALRELETAGVKLVTTEEALREIREATKTPREEAAHP